MALLMCNVAAIAVTIVRHAFIEIDASLVIHYVTAVAVASERTHRVDTVLMKAAKRVIVVLQTLVNIKAARGPLARLVTRLACR